MRAAVSGANARARVGIRVGDCLPRRSRAEMAELFASANTCPPSRSPSLPLVRARINFASLLPPRRKSVRHEPGSAWLKRCRPLRARRIFCAATLRGGGAGCRADSGGARDDEQEAALGACRACQEERDGRLLLPRSCRLSLPYIRSADGAEARANALDLADGSSWAQNGSSSVQCIWILRTDPPAQPEFGSCRRILQRNLIWILPTDPPEQRLDPPEHRCPFAEGDGVKQRPSGQRVQ
jgi:hypothetical protein